MPHFHTNTLGTEAIRAILKIENRWHHHQEIYLEQGMLNIGRAATYLMNNTNPHIQHLFLNFNEKYYAAQKDINLRTLPLFIQDYEYFLKLLNLEVMFFARGHHHQICEKQFEQFTSVFEDSSYFLC